MKGMNAQTGRPLSGDAHLNQSIINILTTPVGTRVLRRDYGSHLFNLIDSPLDGILVSNIRKETAIAINKWEPRLKIERVYVLEAGNGFIEVGIEGVNLESSTFFRSGRVRLG
ncbi:phage baseplate protein [Buttiauxella sp. 3AFRM03]|nr:phage baseplate protein [Buttiauxella sp. 3AFRM03]